jgi:hypothetical protein
LLPSYARVAPPAPATLERRRILQATSAFFLAGGTSLLGSAGCAALAGEETIEATMIVGENGTSKFYGFTEYELDDPAAPDDKAELRRVLLRAPDGFDDMRFLTHVFGEVVMPDGSRTPLVSGEGEDFPANDTMAKLEVLYEDNLRPFFVDGKKIRIEWNGAVDNVNYTYPPQGAIVDALVTIEVL